MLLSAQHSAWTKPPARRWFNRAFVFLLISMSTAAMLLCSCDCVTVHDHHAISLLALAVLFAAAAAVCIYRQWGPDSGITGFLRVAIAIAVAGIGVFVELFLSMEAIAWLARPR